MSAHLHVLFGLQRLSEEHGGRAPDGVRQAHHGAAKARDQGRAGHRPTALRQTLKGAQDRSIRRTKSFFIILTLQSETRLKHTRAHAFLCRNANDDDDDDDDEFIFFIILSPQINSLYGYNMCQVLPISPLEEITDPTTIQQLDWRKMTFEQDHGYLVCVDCHTPTDKHEALRLLPYAPEVEDVTYQDLSPHSKSCLEGLVKNPKSYQSKKLMTSFRPKKRYLVHYMYLQACLDAGMVVDKIHYVYKFKQKRHMLPFVTACNELRRAAKTVVESNLWKGFPNFSYGFTLFRPERSIEATFVTSRRKAARSLNSPRFESCRILSKNLIIIYTKPK